jgi:L-threonylcarbamoyladenylate synthase
MAIVSVDPLAPAPATIERAAALLRAGELVAFPTETVYGLGADALDERAVRRIFEAKGRPSYNPLIVHVGGIDEARGVAASWPASAQRLADHFWPGPLTLVLPKRAQVPDVVTAGLPSVALRVPAHPVAHALLRVAGVPVAAPSANRSTELSPTTAQHVEKSLGDRVALILDAGPTPVGIESTVLDLSGRDPVLLRPGVVSAEDIARVIGTVPQMAARTNGDEPRRSPGMLERHYAPRAALVLYDASAGGERERAAQAARQEIARGGTVGVLVQEGVGVPDGVSTRLVMTMPRTPEGYARRLYAALHELDEAGCTLVLVARVPTEGPWAAVADRLGRAAR